VPEAADRSVLHRPIEIIDQVDVDAAIGSRHGLFHPNRADPAGNTLTATLVPEETGYPANNIGHVAG
jgi:hypothetical protein